MRNPLHRLLGVSLLAELWEKYGLLGTVTWKRPVNPEELVSFIVGEPVKTENYVPGWQDEESILLVKEAGYE